MRPLRPLRFMMHLDRFGIDVAKVSNLMLLTYSKNMGEDGKALLTHNIEFEAALLLQFKTTLRLLVDELVPPGTIDIFGNEFFGFDRYQYVEVTVSFDYLTYSSMRFLGTRRGKQVRYAIYNLPISVSSTTLNIVSDIKLLSDSVEDFFGKISTLMSCRPGSWTEDGNIIQDII